MRPPDGSGDSLRRGPDRGRAPITWLSSFNALGGARVAIAKSQIVVDHFDRIEARELCPFATNCVPI